MSNTFKVGDSVTLINPLTLSLDDQLMFQHVARDTTQGKVYTVASIGVPPEGARENPSEDGTGIYFLDDALDAVQLETKHLVHA